jgi:hypothetical protein
MCDACVRIVAEVGEELGVSIALRSGRAGDLFGCEGCSVEPI